MGGEGCPWPTRPAGTRSRGGTGVRLRGRRRPGSQRRSAGGKSEGGVGGGGGGAVWRGRGGRGGRRGEGNGVGSAGSMGSSMGSNVGSSMGSSVASSMAGSMASSMASSSIIIIIKGHSLHTTVYRNITSGIWNDKFHIDKLWQVNSKFLCQNGIYKGYVIYLPLLIVCIGVFPLDPGGGGATTGWRACILCRVEGPRLICAPPPPAPLQVLPPPPRPAGPAVARGTAAVAASASPSPGEAVAAVAGSGEAVVVAAAGPLH